MDAVPDAGEQPYAVIGVRLLLGHKHVDNACAELVIEADEERVPVGHEHGVRDSRVVDLIQEDLREVRSC